MYSYKTTLLKGAKYFVLFALPFLISQFTIQMPEVANLTVGAILVMFVNWLKFNVK